MTAKLFPFGFQHWFGDKLGQISDFPSLGMNSGAAAPLNPSRPRCIFRSFTTKLQSFRPWVTGGEFFGPRIFVLIREKIRNLCISRTLIHSCSWLSLAPSFHYFLCSFSRLLSHRTSVHFKKMDLIKVRKTLNFFKIFVFFMLKTKHSEWFW